MDPNSTIRSLDQQTHDVPALLQRRFVTARLGNAGLKRQVAKAFTAHDKDDHCTHNRNASRQGRGPDL